MARKQRAGQRQGKVLCQGMVLATMEDGRPSHLPWRKYFTERSHNLPLPRAWRTGQGLAKALPICRSQ
eukprot:9870490-Alexandrium_andersonii.AAC.1